MPARNSRKQYIENGYYHLYNRGVEKRRIFRDEQDYAVFLSYLKQYLVFKDEEKLQKKLTDQSLSFKEKDLALKLLRLNNFNNQITLMAYCLMPNHFHFLIKQKDGEAIDRFMNSICTRYTMYFNHKYKRVGHLYQGVYKAVAIESDEQLVHLTRYIHKQAMKSKTQEQPSSYQEYLGRRKTEWVQPNEVLSFFSKNNPSISYEVFIKKDDDLEKIGKLLLEDDWS